MTSNCSVLDLTHVSDLLDVSDLVDPGMTAVGDQAEGKTIVVVCQCIWGLPADVLIWRLCHQ